MTVLASGTLTGGMTERAFEREFADRHFAAHGVTFASGTAGLTAMLLAEGIGPGDEVIVPSMTFISSATSVRHVGATPVFADIDPRSFNLDPREIARLVTDKTKAAIIVHYAGQPGELDQIVKACGDYGLLVLEDAAQAAGAHFREIPVGTFGRSAMFSFTPTKNITMGEGGIVLTNDADTADKLRLLRNHGQRQTYEHVLIGYNWRLTEIQAAIGRVQLRKLDAILARKRTNVNWMSRRLQLVPGITPPYQLPYASSAHMLYTCLVEKNRNAVLEHLIRVGHRSADLFSASPSSANFLRTLSEPSRYRGGCPEDVLDSHALPAPARRAYADRGRDRGRRRSERELRSRRGDAQGYPMSPLRAAVVGLGTMGRHHVRVLRDLPGVELVGATDPEPRARNAVRAVPVTC